jgi:hypothetical protein
MWHKKVGDEFVRRSVELSDSINLIALQGKGAVVVPRIRYIYSTQKLTFMTRPFCEYLLQNVVHGCRGRALSSAAAITPDAFSKDIFVARRATFKSPEDSGAFFHRHGFFAA